MKTEPIRHSAFDSTGVNFMTPEIIYRRAGTLASGRRVHIELAQERPPYFSRVVGGEREGGPIYGVTIRRPTGERLDPDPSRCLCSREEADAYIKSL
jgi:hypothetical protein